MVFVIDVVVFFLAWNSFSSYSKPEPSGMISVLEYYVSDSTNWIDFPMSTVIRAVSSNFYSFPG